VKGKLMVRKERDVLYKCVNCLYCHTKLPINENI